MLAKLSGFSVKIQGLPCNPFALKGLHNIAQGKLRSQAGATLGDSSPNRMSEGKTWHTFGALSRTKFVRGLPIRGLKAASAMCRWLAEPIARPLGVRPTQTQGGAARGGVCPGLRYQAPSGQKTWKTKSSNPTDNLTSTGSNCLMLLSGEGRVRWTTNTEVIAEPFVNHTTQHQDTTNQND